VTLEAIRPLTAADAWLPRPHPRSKGPFRGHLDEYWPLTVYFYLYPLWWVLGVSKIAIFILAIPMLWTLLRHRNIRVPRGFGVYLLFLAWVLLGVTMLWVKAPGTMAKYGLGPLVGYGYRALWYAAVTIACLYVVNADRSRLSAVRIGRMLAFLFLVTVAGGLLGVLAPNLDFPSFLELFLPKSFTQQEFMNALFHPRVALQSDFLGYAQPRVTAPFSYPNAWGNSFGLLAPFFVFTWFGKTAGARRYVAPFIAAMSLVPVVFSLNRGLWAGLTVSVLWVALRRLLAGDVRALVASLVGAVVLAGAILATPLGTTITTRLNTPHSDERRQDTAAQVLVTTWESSPILGYGSTRQMEGNFDSIAGGAIPGCHQCAAPPLGTQGFLWGLVFMTGFVGAGLMLAFLLWHVIENTRRDTPLSLLASTVLVGSVFYFLFYDSLDVPMLVTMVTVGLAARDHAPEPEALELPS
jgi:hypothetical protein